MENTHSSVSDAVTPTQHNPVATPSRRFIKIAIVVIVLFVIGLVSLIFLLSQKQTKDRQVKELSRDLFAEQANAYMQNNMRSVIKENYRPLEIHTHPQKDETGKVLNSYKYIQEWTTSQKIVGNASIEFRDISILDNVYTAFVLNNPLAAVNAEIAAQTVSLYFTTEYQSQMNCEEVIISTKPTVTVTLCENFWTDDHGVKKGIGLLNKTNPTVFYCEIYPESKLYNRNSCSIYK